MDKSIISKVINDAIIKCRTGGRLSSRVKGTLNRFHKKSEKWKTEKGILIKPNGEIIKELKNGTEDHIKFSTQDVESVVSEWGGI